MNVPENLFYTKEHEWIKIEADKGIIGITDHAQNSLGDITFVELPEVDSQVKQFDKIATIESVKAVSDVYSPVSGKIIKINDTVTNNPEQINQSPYENGWLFEAEIKELTEKENLMDAGKYKEFLKKQEK